MHLWADHVHVSLKRRTARHLSSQLWLALFSQAAENPSIANRVVHDVTATNHE